MNRLAVIAVLLFHVLGSVVAVQHFLKTAREEARAEAWLSDVVMKCQPGPRPNWSKYNAKYPREE